MPQMRAQHAAFAFLAVRLKLTMFASPAWAAISAFEAVCGQRIGDSFTDL